jgi:hypothetical protein
VHDRNLWNRLLVTAGQATNGRDQATNGNRDRAGARHILSMHDGALVNHASIEKLLCK